MADLLTLESAFKKAHAAGDKNAAGALAREIKRMRLVGEQGASSPQPQQEQAVPWYTPITSIPGNAYDVGAGLINAAAHPVDTLDGISYLATGALTRGLNRLLPSELEIKPKNAFEQNMLDIADNAGASLQDAFSSPTKAWNTIATHPVDSLLTAVPGLGVAGKGAKLSGMAGTANALSKASEFVNPINLIAKPISRFTPLRNAPIRGQTRGSTALLKSLVPKDAASRAAAIGPGAMLLDISPSMVGLARGVSAKVGPATDSLVEKLIARQKSNAEEFLPKVDKIMGPQYDPTLLSQSIDRGARKAAAPYYGSAIKNAQPLSSDLADKLARRLTNPAKDMGLENRASMGDIMTKIDDALLGENPKQVAKRLWDNRKTLDAKIVYDNNSMSNLSSADKAAQGVLKHGRKTIDDVLKDNYPGFSRGDQIMAAGKKAQDDIEFGRTSLRNGDNPQTFEVFKKEYDKRDKRFSDIGIKADIRNALTGTPNDFLALRKKLGGDADNNRLKLYHSLGPTITNKLNSFVEGVGTMSQNFADIVRNAKTAQSLEAAKLIPDGPRFKASGNETIHGTLVARPFVATLNYLAEKTAGKVNAATSEALSNSLTKQGSDLTKLLAELSANKKVPLKDKTLIRALLLSQAAQFSTATQGTLP
jgi:hypothetical protein